MNLQARRKVRCGTVCPNSADLKLNKDHLCTFKNPIVNRSMIWHLNIYNGDLTFIYNCAALWIVFDCHYHALHLTSTIFKKAPPNSLQQIQYSGSHTLLSHLKVLKHKDYTDGSLLCTSDAFKHAGFIPINQTKQPRICFSCG